ncbi:MAG TPA: phosphatase PAP2 family protein [Tepidisphaeraceae bacterium]|jgi:membrane-associated phospholipid phosphatase|nr:phosphatase PAP2 family protein [Tepidisphaeraceae bacterium]
MFSGKNSKWILAVLWLIAFMSAFALDQPLAQHIHDHPPVDKRAHATHMILETVKLPGWFWTTLCIAFLLGIFHRRHWLAAIALTLSGIAAGALYSLLKWITGRHRPDHGIHPLQLHPFSQGFPGLWREKALCFPSGHASLAFASAACLAILLPRWRGAFYAIATITCVERILENAHYLSDVIAGIGLGTIVGVVVTRLVLKVRDNDFPLAREDAG